MILKTIELRRFFQNASAIRSKGILPILDFVKIDGNKIIKTNTEAYIEMDITPTGKSMLIDENTLSTLVKTTTSDEIKVEIDGKRVYLLDGRNKLFFQLPDDASLYPEFPDREKEEEYRLDAEVLIAIGEALKNVGGSGLADSFDFVHLSNNYVFGSDHFRFYFKKFDKLPTVSLSHLAASIICQFGGANFYERGNYYFFEIGNTLYGFAKEETVPPQFISFLDFTTKEPYAEINTSEVTEFLELLKSQTSSNSVTCDFKGDILSFHDVDLETGNEIKLNIGGDYQLNKSFLPRLLLPFLKSLGKSTLRISPMKGDRKGVTIWDNDDKDFMGMLGEVTQNSN